MEAGKLGIGVPADREPAEGPLPSLPMTLLSASSRDVSVPMYLPILRRGGALWGLFYEGTDPIHESSTLMISPLPKGSEPQVPQSAAKTSIQKLREGVWGRGASTEITADGMGWEWEGWKGAVF